MKKQYAIIACLLFCSLGSFAQQNRTLLQELPMVPTSVSAEELKYTPRANASKAAGDTLFYEDFGGGFAPNGWIAVNGSQTGFDWIYTTSAPGGQYSTNIPALNSVTAVNGFASLPSDLYNTPTSVAGFIPMAASLTSGPIVIQPSLAVAIRWRQAQRYCCTASEQLELQVSTDNFNWTSFDAKFGRSPSTSVSNEDAEIDISSVASGEDTIYLRFFQSASHYYWMIDDIAVVEGISNQLSVDELFTTFGSAKYDGFYTKVPIGLTKPLSFEMSIKNEGVFNGTNVGFIGFIDHQLLGNVFSDSSLKIPSIPVPFGVDTISLNSSYSNTDGLGNYTGSFKVTSDSVSANPFKEKYTISWSVTDSVFAKDYGTATSVVGPGSYLGGNTDGSRIGTKYTLKSAATINSLSFYISNISANVGSVIKAQVWGIDTTQPTLNTAINVPGIFAQNPIPYTIQASDLGTWLTIPMLPAVSLPSGQYIAVAEQFDGNSNGFELSLGRDRISEEFQPFGLEFVSMIYRNNGNPSWANIFAQPMIRMNFDWIINIKEGAKAIEGFTVSPNPSNGQFNVVVNAEKANFNLSVRNMVGQVVFKEDITVNNTLTKNIDLSNLNKGIYFISVENDVSRKVQKVIIK